MEYSLGFSPCPNDTFIFDALVHQKIDTKGIRFKVYLEDVQTLNEWALEGRLDFSKISFGTWPLVKKEYRLLEAGGAMGYAVGPLLISKGSKPQNVETFETLVEKSTIALPGKHTTAHFLFTHAFPKAQKKSFLPFHEIEEAVLNGKFDMGVIIHENRFTYQKKGLQLMVDLGSLWEQKTALPIPLGGIVAHQRISEGIAAHVDYLISNSIKAAWHNYPKLPEFVQENAQEMDEVIMREHIELYVNRFSEHAGTEGAMAIQYLLNVCEMMDRNI